MNDTWSDDAWDGDEDDDGPDESMLGALDFSLLPAADYVDVGLDATAPDEEDEGPQTIFFTVTNPPGTVSATALMDGRPIQVTLSPQVCKMTESELAEEISLIAQLASQNACAGQHLLVSAMMQQLGDDPVSVRSFVEYELGLPSAETALAEKAQIFATRYAHED
ncbi:YbaB/EbfC family DNA-binding protein [Mycolicibacterium sp. P9-64]|uniref:YbaB/EbfC family DNA-binding protein n=1 Tax=Mycolicibacterium sp. P9-64 TaxID=2024612 RepID=UPI0011EFB5AB|nr:YbaB/EbfC family DNA-binding protein [Mycolicibacterium sp. P9-64]KAA0085420.1 YbaB/EbfC family DNA-binding protein [Mycolicibacterium sp. P9-64]